jgi:hypothetical protein
MPSVPRVDPADLVAFLPTDLLQASARDPAHDLYLRVCDKVAVAAFSDTQFWCAVC